VPPRPANYCVIMLAAALGVTTWSAGGASIDTFMS
jgi:hypothetical protein